MIKRLKYSYLVYMSLFIIDVELNVDENYKMSYQVGKNHSLDNKQISSGVIDPTTYKKINDLLNECCFDSWQDKYDTEGYNVIDGFLWELEYQEDDKKIRKIVGNNAYPWCYYKLIRALILICPELKRNLEEFAKEKKPVYEMW